VGQVQAIGLTLFTDYLLAVELAAVLMLVGLVGAIVLAPQGRKTESASQRISDSGTH
jgi:NADH:ubiquinone oxidoreductase subunit 6 (subunit J)